MFEISKTFAFSAAHRLDGLPEGHPCGRVHGHNYVVEVRIAGPLADPPGFVVDYGDLAPFGAYLDRVFDHRWLGSGILLDEDGSKTVPAHPFNPTAENLAAWFRDWLTRYGELAPALSGDRVTVEVGVSETPKTWARAR